MIAVKKSRRYTRPESSAEIDCIPLPQPSERIVEIRERRTQKLLAKYNLTKRRIEFQRRGRWSCIWLDSIDTKQEIVYTMNGDD